MLLQFKNVGRIREASIEINGITVICGDNDTGKSTIGKLLYCIYASLYRLSNEIRKERMSSIRRSIEGYLRHPYWIKDQDKISRFINKLLDSPDQSLEQISKGVSALPRDNEEELLKEPPEAIAERIHSYLTVSDEEIVAAFLQRTINSEFGGKLADVNTPTERAYVSLKVNGGELSFHTVGKNKRAVLDKYFSLDKRLIYIDDPFILDEIGGRLYNRGVGSTSHRDALITLIQKSVFGESDNVIESIIRNEQLHDVIQKLDEISNGTLVYENEEFMYRHAGLNENLSLVSVSTGIKTFAILRTLLERGYLEKDGIIVLDEPEVHLHPEWQIRLAEITVLLHKAIGLNIVITTHSHDFLTSIDFFSRKYEIREKCRFYLTETEHPLGFENLSKVNLHNMTDNMERLYASISEPFLRIYGQMEGD